MQLKVRVRTICCCYWVDWTLSPSFNADRPRTGVWGLGSGGCLQVVRTCQSKCSMCEISGRVKTNRGSSCDGGEGWEMYTLMYRHRNSGKRRREKKTNFTCIVTNLMVSWLEPKLQKVSASQCHCHYKSLRAMSKQILENKAVQPLDHACMSRSPQLCSSLLQ